MMLTSCSRAPCPMHVEKIEGIGIEGWDEKQLEERRQNLVQQIRTTQAKRVRLCDLLEDTKKKDLRGCGGKEAKEMLIGDRKKNVARTDAELALLRTELKSLPLPQQKKLCGSTALGDDTSSSSGSDCALETPAIAKSQQGVLNKQGQAPPPLHVESGHTPPIDATIPRRAGSPIQRSCATAKTTHGTNP